MRRCEMCIRDSGFAVVANLRALAGLPRFPYLAAVHAKLAGEAEELGQIVERRVGTRIVERQQVHQVEMPGMVATDVVVPLEIARVGVIAVAKIPVARRRDAMQHAAIVQHRQVETAAVPGNDLRCEFLDAIEKALDDFTLALFRLGQRPDFQACLLYTSRCV